MEPKGLAGQLLRGLPDALRPLLLLVEARVQPGVLLVPPDHLLVEPAEFRAKRPDGLLLVRGRLQDGAPPGRSGPRPGRALTGLRCRQGLAQPGVLLAQRPGRIEGRRDAGFRKERLRRRATSACKDGTSLAVRRASFVSSTASLSLRRQALNRDFHEPPSLRAATSAQMRYAVHDRDGFGRVRPRSASPPHAVEARQSRDNLHPAWTRGRSARPRHYLRPASGWCDNLEIPDPALRIDDIPWQIWVTHILASILAGASPR